MFSHEFFHEQAHIERKHELKRYLFLILIAISFAFLNSQLSTLNSQLILIATFLTYRLFCHAQEFEADKLAAEKCGKDAAIESLKFLQMQEGKIGFWSALFSLHPRTEKRIEKI
ncbi:MAG: M48 family metalloprotease [Fibromonadales bacterium]|nr:M48 family metalloprotease [Fibromonadales bacterium]